MGAVRTVRGRCWEGLGFENFLLCGLEQLIQPLGFSGFLSIKSGGQEYQSHGIVESP